MQLAVKQKIKSEIIAAFIAFWLLATREVDWIVMAIARPYLLPLLTDPQILRKVSMATITYIALGTELLHIVVFQLLVIATALIVFFKKKYQIYKRELLRAYLITVIGKIIIVAIYRYFKLN